MVVSAWGERVQSVRTRFEAMQDGGKGKALPSTV